MEDLSRITPSLWLSGVTSAVETDVLLRLGITNVVMVLEGSPRVRKTMEDAGLLVLQIDVEDDPSVDLMQYIPEVNRFIASSKGAVLVHCMAGMSRSPTVMMAHLMTTRVFVGLEQARSMVKAERPFIRPNEGFESQLRKLEKVCAERYTTGLGLRYTTTGWERAENERLKKANAELEKAIEELNEKLVISTKEPYLPKPYILATATGMKTYDPSDTHNFRNVYSFTTRGSESTDIDAIKARRDIPFGSPNPTHVGVGLSFFGFGAASSAMILYLGVARPKYTPAVHQLSNRTGLHLFNTSRDGNWLANIATTWFPESDNDDDAVEEIKRKVRNTACTHMAFVDGRFYIGTSQSQMCACLWHPDRNTGSATTVS